jgi:hypothetical protein
VDAGTVRASLAKIIQAQDETLLSLKMVVDELLRVRTRATRLRKSAST